MVYDNGIRSNFAFLQRKNSEILYSPAYNPVYTVFTMAHRGSTQYSNLIKETRLKVQLKGEALPGHLLQLCLGNSIELWNAANNPIEILGPNKSIYVCFYICIYSPEEMPISC